MKRTKTIGLLLYAVDMGETLINRMAVCLRSAAYKTKTTQQKANTPEGWEECYVHESAPAPVCEVRSEIAKLIIALTNEGDSLLETGCGSGVLSAELAKAGRKAVICDFSQRILNGVKQLFSVSGLAEPEAHCVDITQSLPFTDNQFDVVWSSGVLEHWTDDEVLPIVKECARCARRCVISFVPNQGSLLYRFGRETAEAHGIAPWGRELPRISMKRTFEEAGLVNVAEKTCCFSDAPGLIWATDPLFARKVSKWWNALPEDDPVKTNQGYLLFTVGYKNS